MVWKTHYYDVIMGAMASQITSLEIVYITVYLGANKKKSSKLRVTRLCEGNSPVTGEFLAQRASNAENVSIRWRHYEYTHFPSQLALLTKGAWTNNSNHIRPWYIINRSVLYEQRTKITTWISNCILCFVLDVIIHPTKTSRATSLKSVCGWVFISRCFVWM